jgi:Protein of unknown function (DUF1569)
MPQRRKLRFASLDDVMPEVEGLLTGYETVGNWSLGQICNHLSRVFNLLVDAGPTRTPPNRLARLRYYMARKGFFAIEWFPTGVRAPTKLVLPDEGLNDRAEAEALRIALDRFKAAPGPFPTHPFLGVMSKPEWVQFNCRHCAHHLGFAIPRTSHST